jgi:hypothetical protein
MMNKEPSGTITLPTNSAAAIWSKELTGQFSDGMWENAGPRDHWKFWCGLTVDVGDVAKVETTRPWECKKTRYGIASLYPIVGDRMVNVGRMGTVTLNHDALYAAEYMPATFAEWAAKKASGKWPYDHVARYMEAVYPEIANAYYKSSYNVKDMKRDVAAIKAAMRTMDGR